MHLVLGIGQPTIYFCNPEKDPDVDAMLTRIATAYSTMLCMGHPEINRTYRLYKMIFTDEKIQKYPYVIALSLRPCGIYISSIPYYKQLAKELHRMTSFPIVLENDHPNMMEIGLGALAIKTEGYVMLKDAILALPQMLF